MSIWPYRIIPTLYNEIFLSTMNAQGDNDGDVTRTFLMRMDSFLYICIIYSYTNTYIYNVYVLYIWMGVTCR